MNTSLRLAALAALFSLVTPALHAQVPGNLNLPATTSADSGVLTVGGAPFLSAFGINNDFIGIGAGNFTTTGFQNVALGNQALGPNSSGSYNTAIGFTTLSKNSSGSGNTALGDNSLLANTGGSNNTGLGASSLRRVTGQNNLAIGANGGLALTGGDNNVAIASLGTPADSGVMRIGSTGYQNVTFIAGITGVTVAGTPVVVNSDGQLGVAPSSSRFKLDIADMDRASEALLSLRPVTFHYKPEIDAKGAPQFGLIAEEAARANPDLVVRDASGEIFTVRYEAVNAMLLNEFLKEHKRVEDQGKQLAAEEATISEQQKLLEAMAARLKDLDGQVRQIRTQMPAPVGRP